MQSLDASPSLLSSIFHMYDIRGIYGEQLTDDLAEIIGYGTGTFYRRHGVRNVVVGRDNRPSGTSLESHFINGLLTTGCNVVKIGIVTTPMVYFSWYALSAKAAVAVTASHNPAPYNGIKITMEKQGLFGKQYEAIRQIIESCDFEKGRGEASTKNLWPRYRSAVTRGIKLGRKLKVVMDCGNGTTSLFAPVIFKELGVKVVELFTESDGTFPNHDPYPQKTELYQELAATIRKESADFGVAYDGDGDRVGIYDEKGNFVQNDLLGALFTREILKTNPGSTIVMNISASRAVIEDVKKHGGRLVLWKTGYPFIVSKMKEEKAIFGGEISGHFFFADRYYGYDDGIYSSVRFLELASNTKRSVSELVADLPSYCSSPEFRVAIPKGADKKKIVDNIKQEIKSEYTDAEILEFDGIRFTFKNGSWGLIRPSNTEPLLSGRAEAKTQEDLEKVKQYISEKLAKHGVRLRW